jgi:MFS family permease
MLTSMLSGFVLQILPFPLGYQVIFLVGAFGGGMSSYHIYRILPLEGPRAADGSAKTVVPAAGAAPARSAWDLLRLDIWSTPFRRTLLVLFGFHFTQYLPLPLFSIHYVRGIHLSDDEIGLGTAVFYLTVLIGSTQLRKIVQRVGHKAATGIGVVGMACYPLGMALSQSALHFHLTNLIGGFIFSVSSGAYANYLLDKTPPHDRPSHLAWYNIVLNASILLGSLAGPLVGDRVGVPAALLGFAILRLCAGLAILKWG